MLSTRGVGARRKYDDDSPPRKRHIAAAEKSQRKFNGYEVAYAMLSTCGVRTPEKIRGELPAPQTAFCRRCGIRAKRARQYASMCNAVNARCANPDENPARLPRAANGILPPLWNPHENNDTRVAYALPSTHGVRTPTKIRREYPAPQTVSCRLCGSQTRIR